MQHWGFWEWCAYAALFIAAIVLAADQSIKLAPTIAPRASFILSSSYWAFAPLALVLFATVELLGKRFGWLGGPAASSQSPAASVNLKAFPRNFLTKLERLCADEHEISLRTQMPFPPPDVQTYTPKRLERRDYFRGVIAELETPCTELGLTQTLPKIREALRRLKEDRPTGDGYALFHDVSQSLKSELEDKWRLVRAFGPS